LETIFLNVYSLFVVRIDVCNAECQIIDFFRQTVSSWRILKLVFHHWQAHMNGTQTAKIPLGFFPTPVIELANLGRALGGARIFMKRDDQTGLALGGNKTRKLEYILGDAIARRCDSIITAGASQSNHCRQTAAAAAKLNLECHLILGGEAPPETNGNLLLDKILGCHIHWAGPHRKGEDIPAIYEQLRSSGKNPYVVPYGGSNELGAIAFAEATRELVAQTENHSFSHVVFASSSGGTHAGLMLGKRILDQTYQLVGINIDKGETGEAPFEQTVLSLANRTASALGLKHAFSEHELILDSNYVGEGYGVIGELEKEAILLTAGMEGILLDPVYTGRAMGGLIDMIRSGKISPKDKVLFWHTGGAPALFAYSEKLGLP
jgi:D-cysteine desulfhydrase